MRILILLVCCIAELVYLMVGFSLEFKKDMLDNSIIFKACFIAFVVFVIPRAVANVAIFNAILFTS